MREPELLTDRIRRFFRSTRRLTWKPQEILAEIDRIEIGFLREQATAQADNKVTTDFARMLKQVPKEPE